MDRPTLAQLNSLLNAEPRDSHMGYTTLQHYAVGRTGHRNSGSHAHLVKVDLIIAEKGEHKPGTLKVGDDLSTYSPCNTNGQHIAREIKGYDTETISCTKCLKVLDRLATTLKENAVTITEEAATMKTPIDLAAKVAAKRNAKTMKVIEDQRAEDAAKAATLGALPEAEAEPTEQEVAKPKRVRKPKAAAPEATPEPETPTQQVEAQAKRSNKAANARAKAKAEAPKTVTVGGVVKILWSAEERAALKALIAKEGYMAGCKAFAAANPTRTLQGAQYQAQNALKKA